MDLARCAKLATEPTHAPDPAELEERRRCFWSICLLRRLQGEDFHILDFTSQDNVPARPETTGVAPNVPDSGAVEARITRSMRDEGIVAYVILISETFARTASYVKRRCKPNDHPPWSPESEYSKIIAMQMEVETRVPYTHRFKNANLANRSLEDLQSNRDYWGPWFLSQFMYHTILCLLNHPLLLSLALRNHRGMIPEIFLQHSSDMIASHTNWIIHFLRFFEDKGFLVSDPFLGYCAAVVATIELQLSFTEDTAIRNDKQERFATCVRFVQKLGEQWPHMGHMVRSFHQKSIMKADDHHRPKSSKRSKPPCRPPTFPTPPSRHRADRSLSICPASGRFSTTVPGPRTRAHRAAFSGHRSMADSHVHNRRFRAPLPCRNQRASGCPVQPCLKRGPIPRVTIIWPDPSNRRRLDPTRVMRQQINKIRCPFSPTITLLRGKTFWCVAQRIGSPRQTCNYPFRCSKFLGLEMKWFDGEPRGKKVDLSFFPPPPPPPSAKGGSGEFCFFEFSKFYSWSSDRSTY